MAKQGKTKYKTESVCPMCKKKHIAGREYKYVGRLPARYRCTECDLSVAITYNPHIPAPDYTAWELGCM